MSKKLRKANSSVLSPAPWVKLARILAREQRLTIEFEDGKDQPRIDLKAKHMYIPRPDPYMNQQEQLEWAGRVYHEIGHASTECRDIYDVIVEKELDMRSQLGFVVNLLDDYRQEKTNLGVYIGRDAALCAVQTWAARNGAEHLSSTKSERSDLSGAGSDAQELSTNLFFWYYTMRSSWQPNISAYVDTWASLATDKAKELVQYTPDVEALVGADGYAVYDLAVRILADVQDKTPEEVEQESKKTEGEGSEMSDEDKEAIEEALGEMRKLLAHEHNDPDEDDEYNNPHTDLDVRKGDSRSYTYSGEYEAIKDFGETISGVFGYHDDINRMYSEVSGLSSAVRKLLQVRTQSLMQGGHKRGKLNSKALHRAAQDVPTVFKRKVHTMSTDVAVQLVVDCSGSMSGNRYPAACASAAALVAALQPNNIECEVIGFTHWGHGSHACSRMYEFKRFDERVDSTKLIARLGSSTVELRNNADGEALMWCAPRLQARKAARKLMIVLSDGEPATSMIGDESAFLRDVTASLEKRFEVYGIGIESEAVREFYTEHAVLRRVSELHTCLMNLIKNKIIL